MGAWTPYEAIPSSSVPFVLAYTSVHIIEVYLVFCYSVFTIRFPFLLLCHLLEIWKLELNWCRRLFGNP